MHRPPQHLPQLAHLFLAVADAEAGDHEPYERQLAVELCCAWAPQHSREDVEAVVDTAYLAARSGFQVEVEALADQLCDVLPPEQCARLLKDLGLMARADGCLTLQEARTISLVRHTFHDRLLGSPAPPPASP